MYSTLLDDTICAIATATGGAIGIIRISGIDAICISDGIFVSRQTNFSLIKARGQSLHYGNVVSALGDIIDEVMLSVYHAPHSYTGQDCVEISCHGSTYIMQRIIELLIDRGCRMARPGEFTQRAYLNGKMDLSQAEAVADLIASHTAATHRMALNQLRGGYSSELRKLHDQLLHVTSLLELELDFSDHEELEFADRTELLYLVDEIKAVETSLIDSFRVGNAFKKGIPTVIVGETNAGKSTLLNALLHEERAIVSDVHGTTRDVIEDCISLGNATFRFIDTAGIRETADIVENMGIERSMQKLEEADIILWVIDATIAIEPTQSTLEKRIAQIAGEKTIIKVFNKVDDADSVITRSCQALLQRYSAIKGESIFISARKNNNIDKLEYLIVNASNLPNQLSAESVIVSNARHHEALIRSRDALLRVEQSMRENLSGEFIALDLHDSINALSEIVGEISSQDVLNNIFRNFCIGK